MAREGLTLPLLALAVALLFILGAGFASSLSLHADLELSDEFAVDDPPEESDEEDDRRDTQVKKVKRWQERAKELGKPLRFLDAPQSSADPQADNICRDITTMLRWMETS